MSPPYAIRTRVKLWDATFRAIRTYLRGQGMLEISTPWCVDEVAIEPYIEPVRVGERSLITSPELWMKRLLCAGSGPTFQIAHVHRGGERGARHAPEFHLAEWYRTPGTLRELQGDVERVVEQVTAGVAAVSGGAARQVERWERWSFFDVFEATTGARLEDSMGTAELRAVGDRLGSPVGLEPIPREGPEDPQVEALWLWSAILSIWSDVSLQPWLEARPTVGVHIEAFPTPLAALAVVREGRARRSESFAFGVEISNGYEELSCEEEQRARFERVNALRQFHGLAALPQPRAFLAALAEGDGLPVSAGMALGVDRLLMVAARANSLEEVRLDRLGSSSA